jgi:hypothetical protein
MNIHPYHKSQPTAKAKRQATWKKVIHDVDVAKVTWLFLGEVVVGLISHLDTW